MLTRRPADARGHADHGWLDTWHSFSFADYYDPRHMGFRALRVLNEDVIAPDHGFGLHPHADMEIITWVLSGRLAHRDSLGNGGELTAGEAQVMTAGTGIRHSEANPDPAVPIHLFQLWISTRRAGLKPAYDQRLFPTARRQDRLCPIASGDGRDGSLIIQQDAAVHAALLSRNAVIDHPLAAGRHAWIQVASGALTVNGQMLAAGDGLAVSDEPRLAITSGTDSEFLLIDLP
jgi:redox-sensitive bicupin YhaK (pirin superfamily)